MRKFLSVLLAMAMVLSLTVTSFAADTAADAKAEMAGKTVILHTNDVHGAVEGYAYIAQLKADYEAKGAEVILVDAGDFSQGTTYVSSTKGADAVTMMNAAGYDVVTLGNHEFDYGYAQLKENMSKAKFKVVCADVFNEDGTPIFDASYTYTTKSGVKVGFFGMETPETQTKANPALIKGLTFADKDAFTKAAADQVAALKDADVVICLAHLGVDAESAPYRSTDLYAAVKGIDFIVDGHSHTVMTKGEKGEPIQSTGTAFKNIGVIVIDDASKKIESNSLYEIKEDTAKDAEALAQAAHLERKPYFYTILVSGVDDHNGGSDTNILVAVDAENDYIYGVSIPRDTKAVINGKNHKINFAYNSGGTALLAETISQQLGIPVDFTVTVDLDGFAALVNAICGGVYEVPISMNYDDPYQDLHIHFSAGMQHLSGAEALKVVRFRHNNDGSGYGSEDIGRMQTQQNFLKAVAQQTLTLSNVDKVGEFAKIFQQYVDTDLSLGNLAWLGKEAISMGVDKISFSTLPNEWRSPYIYLDPDATLELVNQYLNPYVEDRTMEDLDIPS